MAKGASNQAQNLFGSEGATSNALTKAGTADRSSIFPFLTNELEDPQGYGQTAVDQMLTQGGQAVSGATGAASEAANLGASRTGNTAAIPGIIDATARNAMKQQSNNALGVDIQNAQLKQKQQQEAASGLEGLYDEDTNAALKAMGLQNDTLGQWTNADKASQSALQGWTQLAEQGALTGAKINAM